MTTTGPARLASASPSRARLASAPHLGQAPALRGVVTDPLYDTVAQRSAAAVIDGYSTSFGWACRLLHEPVRTAVRNIYALVRLADEIVDGPLGTADPRRAGRLLRELEDETYRAIATGYSNNLVVHAFALTARHTRIGAGFQKVNFLRDLADDSGRLGRSYLPGVELDHLTDEDRDRLLDDIDADLDAAVAVARLLPPSSRGAVLAAHGLFAELSARLRRTPASEILRRRVRVPGPRKAVVVARALARGHR